MQFKTADLFDAYEGAVQVADPIFRSYGATVRFYGAADTIKVFEDNSMVRKALEEPGENRVLVVDGGGSLRCALVGDLLAALAIKNGWVGIVVNGCIRDSKEIESMPIGIRALATHPRKSVKRGEGERSAGVDFAGVRIHPGDYVYCDEDGILISPTALDLPA